MPQEPCGMGQEGAGSWEMGLGQAQNPSGWPHILVSSSHCSTFARSSLIPEPSLFCGHKVFAIFQALSKAQQAS